MTTIGRYAGRAFARSTISRTRRSSTGWSTRWSHGSTASWTRPTTRSDRRRGSRSWGSAAARAWCRRARARGGPSRWYSLRDGTRDGFATPPTRRLPSTSVIVSPRGGRPRRARRVLPGGVRDAPRAARGAGGVLRDAERPPLRRASLRGDAHRGPRVRRRGARLPGRARGRHRRPLLALHERGRDRRDQRGGRGLRRDEGRHRRPRAPRAVRGGECDIASHSPSGETRG